MSKLSEEQTQQLQTVYDAIKTIVHKDNSDEDEDIMSKFLMAAGFFEFNKLINKKNLEDYLSRPGISVDDAVIY